jgi:hypothetical protein
MALARPARAAAAAAFYRIYAEMSPMPAPLYGGGRMGLGIPGLYGYMAIISSKVISIRLLGSVCTNLLVGSAAARGCAGLVADPS